LDVLCDGMVVGRIMNAAASPVGGDKIWRDHRRSCQPASAVGIRPIFARVAANLMRASQAPRMFDAADAAFGDSSGLYKALSPCRVGLDHIRCHASAGGRQL
jgi:hypothetical protein